MTRPPGLQGPVPSGPIVILGAGGLLGSHIVRTARETHDVVVLCRQDLNVIDLWRVRWILHKLKPSVIINCAGYTNVDGAEDEPDQSGLVNVTAAANIAKIAAELKCYTVYYSTDFVFADDPFRYRHEDDPIAPRGVYAASKAEGERCVLIENPDAAVIRIGNVYGRDGQNFISKIRSCLLDRTAINLDDERRMTPTSAQSIATMTLDILSARPAGRIHMMCRGSTTWYRFGVMMAQALGVIDPAITAMNRTELNLPVFRPSVVLDNRRLSELGRSMPHWASALSHYLAEHDGALADPTALATS